MCEHIAFWSDVNEVSSMWKRAKRFFLSAKHGISSSSSTGSSCKQNHVRHLFEEIFFVRKGQTNYSGRGTVALEERRRIHAKQGGTSESSRAKK